MKTAKPDLTQAEWMAANLIMKDHEQGDYTLAGDIVDAGMRDALGAKNMDSILFSKPGETYEAINFLLAANKKDTPLTKPALPETAWALLKPLVEQARNQTVAALLDQAVQQAVSTNELTSPLVEQPGHAYEGIAYLLATK